MELQTFINAVSTMRKAQETYYRHGRKLSDLIEAKKLEKVVDRGLKEGIEVPVEMASKAGEAKALEQIELFNEEKE